MSHDTEGCTQDDVTKLTRRKEVHNPVLDLANLDIESRANDSTLVQTSVELNYNLVGAMIVNNGKFSNVP